MDTKDNPHPVDVHVGSRIRSRRNRLGLSQSKLADSLGITFQQVQKYEKGTNRVSASKLWELSHILQCSILYFFEGLYTSEKKASLSDAETSQLNDAFHHIVDKHLRGAVIALAENLSLKPDNVVDN